MLDYKNLRANLWLICSTFAQKQSHDENFIQKLEYWYGFLLYITLCTTLILGYKKIKYHPTPQMGAARYYIGGTLILALCTSTSIALIRGGTLSVGASPISMSDATLYINNPSHTSLILSNPFCIIRTSGKGDINYT